MKNLYILITKDHISFYCTDNLSVSSMVSCRLVIYKYALLAQNHKTASFSTCDVFPVTFCKLLFAWCFPAFSNENYVNHIEIMQHIQFSKDSYTMQTIYLPDDWQREVTLVWQYPP